MKLVLLAVLIAALQSDTTALVEASKAAKAKKKTGTTKVITNADVKKSKGKLIENRTPATQTEAKQEPGLVEQAAAKRLARIAAEERLAAAEKAFAEAEKEVAAIEASYYETNDLDYRDKVIAGKFVEAKSKLDLAKKNLEAAKQSGSSDPRTLGSTAVTEEPRNRGTEKPQ